MTDRDTVKIAVGDGSQIDLETWIAGDVRKNAPSNDDAGSRSRRTSLTRADWRELTTLIARRVETFGSAYKPTRDDTDFSGRMFPPDVRNSGFYPSTGVAKAASWSNRAAQIGASNNLRFLTLRAKSPPGPDELNAFLRKTSRLLGEQGTYLQRKSLAQVWLNVVNIRVDKVTERFDPHFHCLWEIEPENLSDVSDYLRKRYAVWIDEDPVRDIKKAAFYICSGIFDYPEMPHWPTRLFQEAHALNGHKLIRASGPLKKAKAGTQFRHPLCKTCAESAAAGRTLLRSLRKKDPEAQKSLQRRLPVANIADTHQCHCCRMPLEASTHSGDESVTSEHQTATKSSASSEIIAQAQGPQAQGCHSACKLDPLAGGIGVQN